MKVRVIKANEPTYWYAKHIGEEFEVHRRLNRHGEYELIDEPGGSTFAIGVEDCEIVDERVHEGKGPEGSESTE